MFASLMFVWALKGGVHSTPPCLPVAFKARNQSHTFQWCLAQAIIRSLAPVPFTGAPPARLTSVTAAKPFTPEPVTTTLWQEPGELAPSQPKGGGFAPSASKGAPRQPGPVSGHTKSAKCYASPVGSGNTLSKRRTSGAFLFAWNCGTTFQYLGQRYR